jgi:hypothetical protein
VLSAPEKLAAAMCFFLTEKGVLLTQCVHAHHCIHKYMCLF